MMDIWKISELIEHMKSSKWRGVRYIKNGGRRLKSVSTSDLDSERELKPNYMKDRELRKKKRDEPKSFGWVD